MYNDKTVRLVTWNWFSFKKVFLLRRAELGPIPVQFYYQNNINRNNFKIFLAI